MSDQNDKLDMLLDEEQRPAQIDTGWENPPKLSELKQDLTNADPVHQLQVSRIKEWKALRNPKVPEKKPGAKVRSNVQPKLIRKQAEWRYSSLSEPFLSTPDLFSVSPVTWEDTPGANQNGMLLNYQFTTQIDRVSLIDAFVRSAVNDGTVVLRVGWCTETKQVPQIDPVYAYTVAPEMVQQYQAMAEQEQENPVFLLSAPQALQDGYELFKQTGIPYNLIKVGENTTMVTKTIKNAPTLEVCDLNNLYVDPSCKGDLETAKFIIYSFETSMAELKADGRYHNLEKLNVSDGSPLTQQNYESPTDVNFQPEGKTRKRIVAYEYWGYWDTDNTGYLRPIVATWVEGVLIRLAENPYPDGKLPFTSAAYMPTDNSWLGESDAVLLKENQEISGATLRGMIDLMGKSANSQTGFAKGMLDETNKRKFEQGMDYEYNPGSNPATGMHMHEFADIPVSAQYMLNLMNSDAESLTGIKAYAGAEGISGSGLGSTASAVRGALDAASKRELGILRRLSNCLIKAGRKIIAMNAEFLDEGTVVRVTNEQFVPIRKDDLPGNYDLKLTISTAEDDAAKSQQLAFILQTSMQVFGPEFGKKILAKMARLDKMPDLAHEIESFQPTPDPMAQQMQMLQMQLLQAQINLTNAQAQEAGSKGTLNEVKQNTEQARAQQMQSVTDKNSLDFLQKQNGVQHQQALEMERAKGDTALAQQALKQQGTLDQIKFQHNSQLLQNHASQVLGHNSQLQLLRANADLNPPAPKGNS